MAASPSAKKLDRYTKHIGKHVNVSEYGIGVLKYFVAEAGICGVELNDAVGDCDGCDAEGTRFFHAKASHGLFIEMTDVTLCTADGQPLPKKTTKKAAATPKKRFESPPSLRKKINRSSKSTAPKSANGGTKAAAGGGGGGAKSAKSPGSSLRKSTATKKDRDKVDHLATKKSGVDGSLQHLQGARSVVRRSAPPAGAAAGDRTLKAAEERKAAEAADAEAAAGGDTPAEQKVASVLDVPEDWVEAAKRRQADEAEAKRREQEAADLIAQEIRMAEAEKKREEQEAKWLAEAEAEAAKRDAAKAERKATRTAQAAARAADRKALSLKAAEEIAEYTKVVEKEKEDRDAKATQLKMKRAAQKARIAAMMSKVKKRTPTSSAASSAAHSPEESINGDDEMSTLSPVESTHDNEELPPGPPDA